MDDDTLTLDGGAAIVTGAGNGAGRDAGRSPAAGRLRLRGHARAGRRDHRLRHAQGRDGRMSGAATAPGARLSRGGMTPGGRMAGAR
jgi:hypothetical protein